MTNFFKILSILLIISLLSCSENNENKPFESKSVKTLHSFYDALKEADYLSAVDLCHNYWFKYWDSEKTVEFFKKIDFVKGKVQKFELIDVVPGADLEGNPPQGFYFTCILNVTREFGESQEMLVLVREEGEKRFEVLTYNVN